MTGNGWTAAEFFAGIGLARVGLEAGGVEVVWSNDMSSVKKEMFDSRFPSTDAHRFVLGDLGLVADRDLPHGTDLAWASFPCTDLSLAGGRAGLRPGTASSAFWHFVKVLSRLGDEKPRVVALENVTAFASSHNGRDIASAIRSLNGLGYSVDMLSIDARHFVPQSRPRLFLVGVQDPPPVSDDEHALRPKWLEPLFEDPSLRTHRGSLPGIPAPKSDGLDTCLEDLPDNDPRWWDAGSVQAVVDSLAPIQLARLEDLRTQDDYCYRTAYRRMRDGVARWEIRADAIAGCLRTARGGSSRQLVVRMGRGDVAARWMSPREYAALMGVPDYPTDIVSTANNYSGFGDAVCAPLVEWLTRNYLVPVLEESIGSLVRDNQRMAVSMDRMPA